MYIGLKDVGVRTSGGTSRWGAGGMCAQVETLRSLYGVETLRSLYVHPNAPALGLKDVGVRTSGGTSRWGAGGMCAQVSPSFNSTKGLLRSSLELL